MSKITYKLTIDGEFKGEFKTHADAVNARNNMGFHYMARIEPIYHGFVREVYEARQREAKKYFLD